MKHETKKILTYLTLVEEILAKYSSDIPLADFQKTIHSIRERANDPNLYLAIIGETKSGKSTFVNALIREDLLKIDVLQATTATATFIQQQSVERGWKQFLNKDFFE